MEELHTIPPRDITAISVLPAPMSITIVPTGLSTGRSAPSAIAIGDGIRWVLCAPAEILASLSALSSILVSFTGTLITTEGFASLILPQTLFKKCFNKSSVA